MKSVVEYFQEMYGFTIQHAHLPCLQVGNQKKANYLPMEVNEGCLSHVNCLISVSCFKFVLITLCAFVFRLAKLLRAKDIQNG